MIKAFWRLLLWYGMTKEQKLKNYKWELAICESLANKEDRDEFTGDGYLEQKIVFLKNRIFELETA